MFKNAAPSQSTPDIKTGHSKDNLRDEFLRDQIKRDLQHSQKFRIQTIDPITGREVSDYKTHPRWVDGDLTIYFETKISKKAYIELLTKQSKLHF